MKTLLTITLIVLGVYFFNGIEKDAIADEPTFTHFWALPFMILIAYKILRYEKKEN